MRFRGFDVWLDLFGELFWTGFGPVLRDYEDHPGVLDFGAYFGIPEPDYVDGLGTYFSYENVHVRVVDNYIEELKNQGFYEDTFAAMTAKTFNPTDDKIYLTNETYLLLMRKSPALTSDTTCDFSIFVDDAIPEPSLPIILY